MRQFLDKFLVGSKVAWSYLKNNAWWLFLPIIMLLAFALRYTLAFNTTPSLPFSVALVERGNLHFQRNDLIAFLWAGDKPLPKGLEVVKIVKGLPGDKVTCLTIDAAQDPKKVEKFQCEMQVMRPNGQVVTVLPVKRYSRMGAPLQKGPEGLIPEQRYFVAGEHPDSLDSRYSKTGWIRADQIIGKVVWKW